MLVRIHTHTHVHAGARVRIYVLINSFIFNIHQSVQGQRWIQRLETRSICSCVQTS